MKHNVICYRKVFIGQVREAKTRWHAWNMTWAGCVQWFCEFIGCCIAPSCTTPGSCGSLILTICKLKMPSCYGASMIVTTMKWHRILRFAWYHTITMRFHLLFYMILYHARFLSHGVSVCVILYYTIRCCAAWYDMALWSQLQAFWSSIPVLGRLPRLPGMPRSSTWEFPKIRGYLILVSL